MIDRSCDKCERQIEFKKLKKIRGKYFCKKCAKKNREKRREETINESGEKEELKKLDRKIKNEYEKRYRDKKRIEEPPKIKGSKLDKKKEKSSAYIPFEERQVLFGILIKRGMDGEEVKKRIKDLIEQQKQIRESMKQKNKSEDDIKIKQQKILEELWNY